MSNNNQNSLTQECIDAGTDWYHSPEPGTPTPAQLGMVTYPNPTSLEMYRWSQAGLCMWCGGNCPGDQCRLRNCTSCTQLWISNTLADVSDGYQITKEYCPLCRIYLNHVHAHDPFKPDHIICGSKIDPEIKVATRLIDITCPACFKHDDNPAPRFAPADWFSPAIVSVRSKQESTAERKDGTNSAPVEAPNTYVIRLSSEDYEWYQKASYRKNNLQSAAQRAASDKGVVASLVAPDGTVLFTAQPRNE